MKVAILEQPEKLVLTEREQPVPQTGEALVKVLAAGICGSDIHAFQGRNAYQTYPCVPGHEVCGEVIETVVPSDRIQPGDRVVFDPMKRCGVCYPCRIGRYNCCIQMEVMGVHRDGGFAEYVTESMDHLYKVGSDLPPEEAALVEPFTVGAQAVSRGDVQAGEKVIILGAGTIGSAALQIGCTRGAEVLITDVYDERLRRTIGLGAKAVVNVKHEDLAAKIEAFTGGEGPQVIIVAVGSEHALQQALDFIGPAGRIVLIGLVEGKTPIRPIDFLRKELDFRGSRNSKDKFPEVVALLSAEKIRPRPLISHTFDFNDIQEGFRLMIEEPEKAGKIVLLFA